MSVSKDTKTGKWMVQCRVTDWQGKSVHKKKRGFRTKKEAQEWEREFQNKSHNDLAMLFQNFVNLYFEDMNHRLRLSTVKNKRFLIDLKITPYFGKMSVNEITSAHIRKWQNTLTAYRDKKGKPYSQTYLKTINNQLTAIFKYALKYYDLKENPCHKAGSMGKSEADEMLFWTRAEFQKFIDAVQDKFKAYAAFMTLYYTGMRVGELTALTPTDVDLKKATITINKSYQRIDGQDVITPPKTPKSNRVITIPQTLCKCLQTYMACCYNLQSDDRLFPFTKYFLWHEMERGCKLSGVKKIRVHDLRHSHASLLIKMGFSPLLIADRLGHERVETTLDTYSHLYPSRQAEVAAKLDVLMVKELTE
ncbi:tyrosine-type recombinase/integrase [Ethanoligenens sp.]|uniref:site-specific integrase n=1 Tax=Ethanoligenens sp. TaxID=2099655 RepID=UPI0039EBDC86